MSSYSHNPILLYTNKKCNQKPSIRMIMYILTRPFYGVSVDLGIWATTGRYLLKIHYRNIMETPWTTVLAYITFRDPVFKSRLFQGPIKNLIDTKVSSVWVVL